MAACRQTARRHITLALWGLMSAYSYGATRTDIIFAKISPVFVNVVARYIQSNNESWLLYCSYMKDIYRRSEMYVFTVAALQLA